MRVEWLVLAAVILAIVGVVKMAQNDQPLGVALLVIAAVLAAWGWSIYR